jgi:hypothetical protein
MNVRDMVQEINAALDYNPDLKQYTDSIVRTINRHYLQVSSQYQWLFMQARTRIQLRADITGDSTSTLTGYGTHYVELPDTEGVGIINLPPDIVGKTLVNNVDGAEYKITAYISPRKFVVDAIFPAETTTNWTIKFIQYAMPRDCIEVLGIMDRGITNTETIAKSNSDKTTKTMTAPNRGRMMFLDARKEENLYLDRSDTGDPFVSVEEMHENVQAPDYPLFLNLKGFTTSTLSYLPRIHNNNKKYTIEYCYTFTYAGMESPPSGVSSILIDEKDVLDTDNGSPVVTIKGIMDTSDTALSGVYSNHTGKLKKVYRRIVFETGGNPSSYHLGAGAWRHIATLSENTIDFKDKGYELTLDTVYDSDADDVSKVSISGEVFGPDRLNESGPRQYLRFWYTPKSDYMIEARYHKRPYRLVKDSDSPEWPPQYHHYLVYSALRDICMQHSMLNHSQMYERRASEILERMKNKYLTRTDRIYVRRGFDRAMADTERFGIPSKAE